MHPNIHKTPRVRYISSSDFRIVNIDQVALRIQATSPWQLLRWSLAGRRADAIWWTQLGYIESIARLFQIFFMFTPIWGRFPFWLTFFKWVETTNETTCAPKVCCTKLSHSRNLPDESARASLSFLFGLGDAAGKTSFQFYIRVNY